MHSSDTETATDADGLQEAQSVGATQITDGLVEFHSSLSQQKLEILVWFPSSLTFVGLIFLILKHCQITD